jgi:acetoin utilization deacetylase AcuC-like enzyme
MILLYLDRKNIELIKYGILIPISPDKANKVIEHLNKLDLFKDNKRKILKKFRSNKIRKKDLLRVHSREYVGRLYSKELENEILKTYELIDSNGNPYRYDPSIAVLPLKRLFKTILYRVTGTYLCLKYALKSGFCFYLSGGMHHAKRDYGEGFCVLNDAVIAIRKLQAEGRIKTVWIIDVDVHKGDGTAALTENDTSIITLSVHMAKGWPLDKKKYNKNGNLEPSFIPSNIDIPIKIGEDDKYNSKLEKGLNKLEKDYDSPDIAVILSGSDPYELDELESSSGIKLSLKQLFERDKLIYNFLKEKNIPQACLMAGGYGKNSWRVHSQFLEWVIEERVGNYLLK